MTTLDRYSLRWRGVSFSILTTAAVTSLLIGGLGNAQRPGAMLDNAAPTRSSPSVLGQRLAAMDAAIARGDVSRAVHEWRDAYGAAISARRWEAMADLGDAAVRIDALAARPSGHPTGFRAAARQAYLRALFQARSQRAPEGIERVAQAFAALGDTEMANRARALGGATR